jgi:threonine synthase
MQLQTMQYGSTRGGAVLGEARTAEFTDILLGGLAADGGLAMPLTLPAVSLEQLNAWRGLSYAQLAFEVLRPFATDMAPEDLRGLVERTYTPAIFGDASIVPLQALESDLYLLKLSQGPTLAFKDMAMQLLGNLFEWVLAQRGQTLNIVGATSGDTGSAAEYAMRGKRGVRVVMLSPAGRMSPFQTAQMFSLLDDNILNVAVEGVFDTCQDLVKAVSNDAAFKARWSVGTVNSINWARVLAQVVYYVHGWLRATDARAHASEAAGDSAASGQAAVLVDQPVSFTVPSGNFGNVLAGHLARRMGVPIHRLVVATNENDVLDEFFRTGRYAPRAAANTWQTSSPSMDISKASNFERFVYDLYDGDGDRVAALWRELDRTGSFDLAGSSAFARAAGEFGFYSGRSTHAQRLQRIRDAEARYQVTIDPHTADGLTVAQQWRDDGVPMIVLETAQAIKFAPTIREALGREPQRPSAFVGLEEKVQRFVRMAPDLAQLQALIARHCA